MNPTVKIIDFTKCINAFGNNEKYATGNEIDITNNNVGTILLIRLL